MLSSFRFYYIQFKEVNIVWRPGAGGMITQTPLKQSCHVKKETLAQVLSCEFCEISKNTYYYRTSPDKYFFQKLFSFLIYFHFCSDFFGSWRYRPDYKTNITQYVKKERQPGKFGRLLIKHNMRNIFLGKPCTKCGGKASPKPFYKKSKLRICVCPRRWLPKLIETKVPTTCFYLF